MPVITKYPVLKELPVDGMALSEMNPRKTVDPDSIAALADSIRVCGLMQNLAGLLMGDDMVLIVAGGRRMRALQTLRAAGEGPEFVPVLLTDDIEQARAWAMAENTARSDLNPADEIGAYAAMARAGQGIPQIAAAFGVTELQVQRRLKLGTLDDDALMALREGEINLSQAAALLLCESKAQSTEYLTQAKRQGVSAEQLRRHILSERVKGDDRRVQFVGMMAYRAAGGAVTTDLFSSDVVIEDVALLDRLFQEAVDDRREEFIADGWKWAEFEESTYIATWQLGNRLERIYPKTAQLDAKSQDRYDALKEKQETDGLNKGDEAELAVYERALKPAFTDAQRSHAGVFFCVRHDGSLDVAHAFVRSEDKPEAIAAGILRDDSPAPGDAKDDDQDRGAEFSQALLADLRAIRLSALQESILNSPQLARAVLAYGLASGTAARPLDVAVHTQPNAPKIDDGFRQAWILEDEPKIHGWQHAEQMPLDELTQIITNRLIRALVYGFGHGRDPHAAWDELLEQAAPDLRARWRPTKDNFFGRVPVAYLDRLFCQLLDLDPASADAREFAKMKKGEKANLLNMLFDPDGSRTAYRLMTDTALAKIESWVPEFV